MNLKLKERLFSELCCDFKLTYCDATEPYLERIEIDNNKINLYCQFYSKELEEYVSCNAGVIEDKELVKKFKTLDLSNKNDVTNFMNTLENYIDWNKVQIDLHHEESERYRYIKILGTWVSDYDDMCCNAILIQGDKEVANIIASFDETDLRHSIGNMDTEMNKEFVNRALKYLIYEDFDEYLNLPKISISSNILKTIYDNVCSSDANMCHVDNSDWKDWMEDYGFTEKDIDILKDEIKKYGLEEVITIDNDGYKIVGYGDLQTRFNDDRNLKMISKEMEGEYEL